jgi:2-C-methyl-D-erythritol 4-phosphate cytidylyltransferase
MTTGAVIVAAGRSSRMGGVDKLLLSLGGRPLLAHSLATIANHPAVDRVAIVCSEGNLDEAASLATVEAPSAVVVPGGARRRDSVRAGVEALPGIDHVVIHDGARPFVTPPMIDSVLAGARLTGAALCAIPMPDTVKRANLSGLVRSTVSREGLWLAQTPQAFQVDLLLRAHQASDIDATDDASLVELLGEPVRIVLGSAHNLKITLPEDLALAEALFASIRRGEA